MNINKKLLVEILFKEFERNVKVIDNRIAFVYSNLFKTFNNDKLGEHLEFIYQIYNGEIEFINKEDWFYDFHKSLRQTSVCLNSLFKMSINDLRSEKEINKQEELKNFLWNSWNNSDEKKNKCSRFEYWVDNHKEELNKYNKLCKKSETKKYEDVGYIIDVTLWNLIHIDKERVLEKVFVSTFEEYKKQILLEKIK